MTEWDPATEVEAAMRDALRVSDQELYFRLLARTELLLPVSADALAGRAPMGWGTWNSGGRTHVLAFTSTDAMRVCLAEHAGSARKIAYHELAAAWPNHEWWLAVNPGLPIEGYLPPWFVGQLARGDVRLPGRSMAARARVEHATASTRSVSSSPRGMWPGGASQSGVSPSGASPAGPSSRSIGSRSTGFDAGLADSTYAADPEPTRPLRSAGYPDPAAPPGSATPPASLFDSPPRPTHPGRAAAGSTAAGWTEPPRRPRRYESTIIDAEIIESTVMGVTALEATVVNATVIDASLIDSDVIDATVIDVSADPITTAVPRRTGQVSGRASAQRVTPRNAGEHASMDEKTTLIPPGRARAPAPKVAAPFVPANEVEENLLAAATSGKTDNFLSTLLLAKVLIPIPTGESPDVRLDNPAFPWRREVVEGQAYLVVFTSPERMAEFMGDGVVTVTAKYVQLIRMWPDVNWAFAVNPGSPVGATLPGAQVKALAAWADDVGLTDEPEAPFEEQPGPVSPPSTSTIIMQKPIAPSQVDYYLERGYDRVSGFVHRATEVAHLQTPEQLYSALGLSYTGSPFERKADEVYVLRWAAHRGDLYRIPYGGQHEAGMRAMQGWIIERAPFRGNGFAPAERGEVIAEFKVDSIRLPHGAQMWRLTSAGDHTLVATLDSDECTWRSVRQSGAVGEWDPTVVPVSPPERVREPDVRTATPAIRRSRTQDPADDPLDPRWRGRPVMKESPDWTASRAGDR